MRYLAIVFCFLVASAQAGTIGYVSPGTNSLEDTTSDPQRMNVTQTYTPSGNETVTSVTAYVGNCGGGSDVLGVAVYDVTDASSSNWTLVGSTTIVPGDNTAQEYSTTGLSWSLTSGNDYAIAFKVNGGSCNHYRNWGGRSNHTHDTETGADAWPANWSGTPGTSDGWDYRVYATTEAAASAVNVTPIFSHIINQ